MGIAISRMRGSRRGSRWRWGGGWGGNPIWDPPRRDAPLQIIFYTLARDFTPAFTLGSQSRRSFGIVETTHLAGWRLRDDSPGSMRNNSNYNHFMDPSIVALIFYSFEKDLTFQRAGHGFLRGVCRAQALLGFPPAVSLCGRAKLCLDGRRRVEFEYRCPAHWHRWSGFGGVRLQPAEYDAVLSLVVVTFGFLLHNQRRCVVRHAQPNPNRSRYGGNLRPIGNAGALGVALYGRTPSFARVS